MLENLENEKHPAYETLKEHGVKLIQIANCLGIGYQWSWMCMNGYGKLSCEREAKLEELVREVTRPKLRRRRNGGRPCNA